MRAQKPEILTLIAEVEYSKQIHISDEERAVLCDRLFELNDTMDNLRKRAKAVERNNTYRSIAFEYWLGADDIFTQAEMEVEVLRIIQRKADRLKKLCPQVTEDELAALGLIDIQSYWEGKRREAVQKHVERIDKHCRKLRAQFYKLPDQAKIDLWQKAVAKNVAKDGDRFAMQILPLLVPFMIEEFEEAIKNNSVSL